MNPLGVWQRLPLLRSIERYERSDLRGDLTAGTTVGVMLIPQGMAYAMIAGLPPVYGLYAALVPLAVYALWGTSRQLAVGPVAMVSLLVATGVAPLAGGAPERYVALAMALAALVGVLQLAMGYLRAGFLVNLLSHPVLAGFTSAAAIIIATSQLPALLGLSLPRGEHAYAVVLAAGAALGEAHGPTLVIGSLAIAVGIFLRRRVPALPAPILLVAVGTVLSWVLALGASGVQIVGTVPSGLPSPGLPGIGTGELGALVPIALTIALIGFMESIAVAKVYASKNRYDVDADQELKALGAANLVGSVFQSFPVTGGFSRTAVNGQAGARSQLSSLVSVGVIAITLLFLTPLFYHLPKAILASIIVVAVAGLVDVREALELWRVDRRDFGLMLATFVGTLALGIETGILVGAALSILVVLHQITRPQIAVLGRLPGTRLYRNVERNSTAIAEPGVEVLRMDASLFYGNAEALRDAARSAFERARDVDGRPVLVLDAYPMNRTDSTGLHMLRELVEDVHAQSGLLLVASAKGPLRDKLEAGKLVDLIGRENFFAETHEAVDAAIRTRGGSSAPSVMERRDSELVTAGG